MIIAISPYSTNKTTPLPHDYATKVRLFWERFHGWKLDIAAKMLDGYESEEGERVPPVPHAGFAAMDAMFSFFEPLGKYLDGYLDLGNAWRSGHYFKEGIKAVFDFSEHDPDDVDKLLGILWTGVRCGLYHIGQTKKGVLITGDIPQTIRFELQDEVVIINPHRLAGQLISHLAAYRDRLLREGEDSTLGKNFTARYDHEYPAS